MRGISTDPDNPVKSNPADPVFHENTFDWRKAFYPPRPSYNCNLEVGGIENPYFEGSVSLMVILQDALSDFHPADGWELIHWGTGAVCRLERSKGRSIACYGP